MNAIVREPDDLQLWRERQRAGHPTPWDEFGIRFLGDERPMLLDTSYLTEEDLADSEILANVRAMADTDALIVWVAEGDGGRAYGYWSEPPGQPSTGTTTATGDKSGRVLVSLDNEGQYMVLPGRNLTEALCADCAEYDDDTFAALAQRARAIAAETDPDLAAVLVTGDTIAELHNPVIMGPGAYRHSRYTALLQDEPPSTHPEPDPGGTPAPDSEPASGIPLDLVRWRERAAAGETAPWDRFGIRFLTDGEIPSAVGAPESSDPEARLEAEATRLTAERATWVVEDGDGRGIGYWHGPDNTAIDAAEIIVVEPGDWFDRVPGRTLTEALCADFGEYDNERVAGLVQECRALGFEVIGDAVADFPFGEAQHPRRYRDDRLGELKEAARPDTPQATAESEGAVPRSTASISGDLLTVITALGHGAESPEAHAALALFGPPFTRSQYPIGPVTRTYYVAEGNHTQLIFEDGILTDAMIRIKSNREHAAYPVPETLIDGIGPETTREEILARFGEPAWSNEQADRFWIDTAAAERIRLRFQYSEGRVEEISISHEPDTELA